MSVIRAKGSLNHGNVEVSVDRSDLEVFADPLFDKVFYNLIQNALPYGGDPLASIRISLGESDTGLVIICEDDGQGISDSDKNDCSSGDMGKIPD